MSSVSPADFSAMQQRTQRARDPQKAAAEDAKRHAKWAAGEESKLSAAFATYLMQRGLPFIVSIPGRRATIAVGHPDYSIFWDSRAIFVELKVEGGVLSQAQKDRMGVLVAAAMPCFVAWNLKDAIDFVRLHFPTP